MPLKERAMSKFKVGDIICGKNIDSPLRKEVVGVIDCLGKERVIYVTEGFGTSLSISSANDMQLAPEPTATVELTMEELKRLKYYSVYHNGQLLDKINKAIESLSE